MRKNNKHLHWKGIKIKQSLLEEDIIINIKSSRNLQKYFPNSKNTSSVSIQVKRFTHKSHPSPIQHQ